jgi:hypothetical protein
MLRIREFIPDPDFYPYRILDPQQQQKRRGENFFALPFFVATNQYHKIVNNLIFEHEPISDPGSERHQIRIRNTA